jgi:hypothetical protein
MNPRLYFHMSHLLHPFYQTDDLGGGGGGGGNGDGTDDSSNLDRDMDILGDDDVDDENPEGDEETDDQDDKDRKPRRSSRREKEDGEGEEEDEDKDENEDSEEDELAKELDEEEDEDEDKDKDKDDDKKVVQGRPTPKQLKEAGVFKQFPAMKAIYFNEQAYAKVFDSPQVAEEAATKAAFYDDIEQSVLSADPAVLLKNIKDGAPEAYEKYVDNFLGSLKKLDQDSYLKVITPVIEDLLYHATQYGTKRNNANLVKSAKHIADYVFQNGGEIPDIKGRDAKHPAEIELEKEREKNRQTSLNNTKSDINGRIDKSLVGFVTEGLPNGLSKLEKDAILDKSINEVMDVLSKDRRFSMNLRGLWRRAEIAGYSEQSKEAIYKAHVARAKTALREIRDRMVQEALQGRRGGRSRREEGDKEQSDKNERPKKRQFDTTGRAGNGAGRRGAVLDPKQIDYKNTSDADILSDDPKRVKLRGR